MQKFIALKIAQYALLIVIAPMILSCKINPPADFQDPIDVTFLDPNFETLIRETLDFPSGIITNERMWSIEELNGSSRNITNISGIEHCSGLHKIYLSNNQISDIEELTELVLLDVVNLSNNNVKDLTPLLNNYGIGIGIDSINVIDNPLNDVSIYQMTPQIRKKGVILNTNATPAAPGLILFADSNFESVIRESLGKPTETINTSELNNIINIDGRDREILNIYGLEFCANLESVDLSLNFISDFSPILNLTKITKLNLDASNLKDISDFSNLTNLESLSIGSNSIADISTLASFPKLKSLSISDNPLNIITVLSSLDNLETLDASNLIRFFRMSQIKTIKNLKTLILSNSVIINFDQISNITTLENAFLANCKITYINPLSKLSQIKRLFLNNNSIDDLSPLENLQQLRELELGNNNISNILPLVNNVGLQGSNDYVLIYNNPLSDETLNTYIPQLQARGVNVIF